MENKKAQLEIGYIERVETFRIKDSLSISKIRFIISVYALATNRRVMTYGQFKTYDEAVIFATERHIAIG